MKHVKAALRVVEGIRLGCGRYAITQPGAKLRFAVNRCYLPALAVVGVLIASAAAQAASPAMASGANADRLSTMDYIEIELLAARLEYGADTGDDYGYLFADTFTPDGELVANKVTTSGRLNLAAMERAFAKANPMYVGHIIANHVIEPSPEGATGLLYEVVVDKTERKGAGYSEHWASKDVIRSGGLVKETYVRTPNGWRIKRRELVSSAVPAPWQASTTSSGGGSTSGRGLTAQDNVEIRQLVARYAYALDSGAQNGSVLADLFSADGELIISKKSFKGRDAIAELGRKGWIDGDRPANPASHFLTNQIVEMSASGSVGRQYMIKGEFAADGGPGKGFTVGGHYEDQYTHTAAGWRFKRREFIEDEDDKNATIPVIKALLPAVSAPLHAAGTASTGFTPGVLTADDYSEIRQLDSHYGFAVDLWSPDVNGIRGESYAQIYTPDGEIHAAPQRVGGVPVNMGGALGGGPEALRKVPGGGGGPNFVNHYNFNRLIEPSANGARGKVSLLVIFPGHGAAADITVVGHYDVEYRKTPDGWRIYRRTFYASTPDVGEYHAQMYK
jgi:hypothetical protein